MLWKRRTPARQAHRRVITVTSRSRAEKLKLPFRKIHPSVGVKKRLSEPQLRIPQGFPLCLRPPDKTGEILAVNRKAENEAILVEKSAEDLIET